ncbi:MAG: hypothetical protein ACXADY_16620 [Candidatus Hodarchaeales archaeon]|jgi:hypothetical protein
MFELEEIKKDLPKSQVDLLIKQVREEFPEDEMMYELHLLRALKSLKE